MSIYDTRKDAVAISKSMDDFTAHPDVLELGEPGEDA